MFLHLENHLQKCAKLNRLQRHTHEQIEEVALDIFHGGAREGGVPRRSNNEAETNSQRA